VERFPNAPSWRASLGALVTLVAAIVLAVASWQAYRLSNRAGADVEMLARERVAVQFQQVIFPLLLDIERYRLERELLDNTAFQSDLRPRIDSEFAQATSFVRAHDARLEILEPWSRVQHLWSKARRVQRIYSGTLLDQLDRMMRINVLYRVEDVSGLEYETNRFAQDLADMSFAKLPSAVSEIGRGDLHTENAQTRGSISIPERIELAGQVSAMNPSGGDFDLTTDDWTTILSQIPRESLGTQTDAARYRDDGEAFAAAGRRIADYENANVVMRDRPQGNPVRMRELARSANAVTRRLNADLTEALNRQLTLRTTDALARNRYVYAIVLLSAMLLIGIMLLVAEFTARRDRDALLKAQQESERLSTELARQNAEHALRLSEAQFRAVFGGAAMGIAILDRSGAILDANAVFRNIYGDNTAGMLEDHHSKFAELMRGERDLFEFEQHVMTPAGQEAWTDLTVSLVSDDAGNPYFAICMFRDLTELKRSERQMQHDMTHDSLTGLPNRAHFEEKVREELSRLKTSPQSSFAVLFVDLDRFKDINESLGHEAGDFVISQVGHRLRAVMEGENVIARLGSDEFAVLVQSLPDVLHVEVIARRVLVELGKPISLGDRSIFVSASIGIVFATGAYQRGEDIMRDADIAMRYAKTGGGGRLAIFDSKMHARAQKRLQLTTDLRLALEREEFDMFYQPILDVGAERIVGCEALLRWNHPSEGMMLPAEFMPLAEQTGLAVPIGRFVVRTVCRQAAQWKRDRDDRSALPINVNVSAAELLDPDFEFSIMAAVNEFDVDPADLTLEITESVVLDAGTRANALVQRLRNAGFNICIDDFGTGYSSLRYLQQFEVDTIKIDRSFVTGPDGELASEPIVRTLMTLAEAFNVRVVAEGIETQRQRDALLQAGCRYGQGFYYARALRARELTSTYASAFEPGARHASA